jgi:HEPN domain-containing protein
MLKYLVDKKKESIENLVKSSNRDWATLLSMYECRRYYAALFFGQLVLEKLLKAIYIKKNNDSAPFIHDLKKIAKKSGLEFDEKTGERLDIISGFNINARYDDYKDEFYRKATKKYAKDYIEVIKGIRLWLKKQI